MTRTYVGFAQAWVVPGYTATATHPSCNGTLGTVLAISTLFFAVDPIISFLTFCNINKSVTNTLVDRRRIMNDGRLYINIETAPTLE